MHSEGIAVTDPPTSRLKADNKVDDARSKLDRLLIEQVKHFSIA